MMKLFLRQAIIIVFLLQSLHALCQNADSTSVFAVSGYIDAYYAHYTDSVGIDEYQKFPSINSRSDAFGLNTAMLTVQYDAEKVRGLISLHYGDIAQSAWSPLF